LALFGAFGSTAMAETNSCEFVQMPTSFRVISDYIFEVQAGRNLRIRVDSFCYDLRWARSMQFRSPSSWVCSGDYVSLYDAFGGWLRDCRIEDIARR